MPLRFIPAIHRAAHGIALSIESAPRLGVNQAEAHILSHLVEHGTSTIGDLHRALAHKRSTLTSILHRLAARRLVTRGRSPHDGRAFVIALTGRGRALATRVQTRLSTLERIAARRVSQRTAHAMLAALAELERPTGTARQR